MYYLKRTKRAAIRALRTGDTTVSDNIHEHNKAVLKTLYDQLVEGKIDVFYTRYRTHDKETYAMTVWHRSTRDNVEIQESHLWEPTPNDQVAMYHADINSFDELIDKHGYTTGTYYRTLSLAN